jgi:hypothetical protein
MNLRLLVSLIFVIFSACTSSYSSEASITNSLINQSNQKLKEEGFDCVYSGILGPTNLRGIIGGFNTINSKYHFASVDKAREFMIEKINEYVKPFNEEKRLRLFMHDFPFTGKNLELSFMFFNDYSTPVQPPFICEVAVKEGTIFYSTWDPINKELKIFHSEPYEKALRILKEGQN